MDKEIKLTPSFHGELCAGSGDTPGIECQCDECDYYLACFPDWEAVLKNGLPLNGPVAQKSCRVEAFPYNDAIFGEDANAEAKTEAEAFCQKVRGELYHRDGRLSFDCKGNGFYMFPEDWPRWVVYWEE